MSVVFGLIKVPFVVYLEKKPAMIFGAVTAAKVFGK